MKDAVLIKSFPNGIALHLDAEAPFEEILKELAVKFSEGRNFFGTASMALSIEGRIVTDAEELQILKTIRENSKLRIYCILGKDENTNKEFVRAISRTEQNLIGGDEGQFYKGTLKNQEVVETDTSIIVLGDVNPGCAVISSKNIIILGGLYGEAYAGGNGREGAFVAALEMAPERIKIGDFKYKPGKKPKWGVRPKAQPKIAFVKDERIVFDSLTKDLLSTF